MNNIRNNIKRDFTTIPNALINDNELTDRARFLFCYMAAKPDDWKFYQNKISKDLKLSVETIRKYISELEESGWLSRELVRSEGKFDSYDYTLNNSPCRKKTDTVKNHDGKIPTRKNLVLTKEIPLQKNTINKKDIEEPQKENELLVKTVKQVEGFLESTYEIFPSITSLTPPPNSEAPPAPKKERKQKDQAYKIFPPTLEEVVPLMYDKLVEKKLVHTNIMDCWNNANMQAEKFILHHEGKGWKIQKLNSAIALWVNNAIGYGQVTKPCPIQYKGNPANAQPAQPTKVHVEQPVLTQQDIEASEQYSNAAADVFKSLGVIMKNT